MNPLSADRQSYLTHMIVENLLKGKKLQAPSRDVVSQKVTTGILQFMREWSEVNQAVRLRIDSLKRGVKEGNSEWEVLYTQYFEEIYQRKSSLFFKDKK